MNPHFEHALLDLMVEQMYFTVPIAVAVSLLMGFVLTPIFGIFTVGLWFSYGMLVGVGRVLLFKRIMPGYMADKRHQRVKNIIVLALILSGLHWGSAAWLFLDAQNSEIYLFVAAVILGMVSASLANLSAFPNLWLLHTITVFAFGIARMMSDGNWSGVVAAIVFVFGLWGLSRKLGAQILASITKDFENEELLKEVNLAKEKAEQANIDKSRFMAATSHDLRQPLHAQSLFMSALRGRLTTDAQIKLMAKLTQSNQALNSLFDSLLEISQLDANTIKINRSHQSLLALCEDLISEFEPLARQRQLSLDLVGADGVVYSDPILFKRIVRNLLSNGIKYTQNGGVVLKLDYQDKRVMLSVIDTGIGISQSDQGTIFDEYVQLANQARDRTKGVGLGLALVKRMCTLLDHEIELESDLGKGSRFTITLPQGDFSKVVTRETELKAPSIEGLTVFVIDDDQPILESLRELESDWHCRFNLFSNLQEARFFLENNDVYPDVIVSDYRLTDGATGVDAIAELRAHFKDEIPAMLISGDTDPELLVKMKRSGVYMLHKPLEAEKLKTAIAFLGSS